MCSTLRSTLLLFGGRAGPMRPKNDCHEYDPMSGEWQELSQTGAVPSARWRHTLTRLRSGRIVLVGGRDSCGVCLESSCAEVHLAEAVGDSRCPASAAWTSLEATGSVPGPRYAHCAATANDGDTLVISGGIGPNRLHATPLHVLKVQRNGGASWTTPSMTPNLPRRYSHGCVTEGQHVLLVGGVGSSALTWKEQFLLIVSHRQYELLKQQKMRTLIRSLYIMQCKSFRLLPDHCLMLMVHPFPVPYVYYIYSYDFIMLASGFGNEPMVLYRGRSKLSILFVPDPSVLFFFIVN